MRAPPPPLQEPSRDSNRVPAPRPGRRIFPQRRNSKLLAGERRRSPKPPTAMPAPFGPPGGREGGGEARRRTPSPSRRLGHGCGHTAPPPGTWAGRTGCTGCGDGRWGSPGASARLAGPQAAGPAPAPDMEGDPSTRSSSEDPHSAPHPRPPPSWLGTQRSGPGTMPAPRRDVRGSRSQPVLQQEAAVASPAPGCHPSPTPGAREAPCQRETGSRKRVPREALGPGLRWPDIYRESRTAQSPFPRRRPGAPRSSRHALPPGWRCPTGRGRGRGWRGQAAAAPGPTPPATGAARRPAGTPEGPRGPCGAGGEQRERRTHPAAASGCAGCCLRVRPAHRVTWLGAEQRIKGALWPRNKEPPRARG